MSIESILSVPEEFERYGTQVAGHMLSDVTQAYDLITPEALVVNIGILRHKPTGHLMKAVQPIPRGEREVCFYEMVFLRRAVTEVLTDGTVAEINGVRVNPEEPYASLGALVPTYFGTRAISVKEYALVFLELEDITAKYTEPNILDVKIGARTWDPSASAEKIQKSKDKYPLGQKLGFRFLGMNIYGGDGQRVKRDKLWGRKIKESDIMPALHEFTGASYLDLTYRHAVVTNILSKVLDVRAVFNKQTLLTFYSTSLLIVYEGKPAPPASPSKIEKPVQKATVDVKMIDFTHVHYQREPDTLDENYLNGLNKLIVYLTQLRDQLLEEMNRSNKASAVPISK